MYVSTLLLLIAVWLFVRVWWGHLPRLIAVRAGMVSQ